MGIGRATTIRFAREGRGSRRRPQHGGVRHGSSTGTDLNFSFAGVTPFHIAELATLALLFAFPSLSLFLT